MGRALFSVSHVATTPEPAIRTQPELQVDSYEKWSAWNRFDPDSEDFFQDAEYEAFIDPVHLEQHRQSPLGDSPTISDSGDSTENDGGSPIAVGSDDPAIIIRGTYNPVTRTWDANINPTRSGAPVWMTGSLSPPYPASSTSSSTSTSPAQSPRLLQSSDQMNNPPFIPPASFRAPSPAIEGYAEQLSDVPQSLTSRRALRITPVSVPHGQPPSPEHLISPILIGTPRISTGTSTTPRRAEAQPMVTPSPPPSVTPRFYSWQHHPIPAMPTSPTVIRGNTEGPLTNPRARISYTRIETTPARVRVPNTVM